METHEQEIKIERQLIARSGVPPEQWVADNAEYFREAVGMIQRAGKEVTIPALDRIMAKDLWASPRECEDDGK